jgi:hypothetical protein
MSHSHAASDTRREPGQYEIRLKGHLEARWVAWFDGLSLTQESDGTTVIRGSVIDQAVTRTPSGRCRAENDGVGLQQCAIA